MRHLLLSYHTCPTEEPGEHLSGGMNILIRGLLAHTGLETVVVTRALGTEIEEVRLSERVSLVRLPCSARLPWTRRQAFGCLPEFQERLRGWLANQPDFKWVSAHYWMSARLMDRLALRGGIVFHTLQAQKGRPQTSLERERLETESQLIEHYACGFLHWHDLHHARMFYPGLRGTVLRPGVEPGEVQPAPPGPPFWFGWAARNDPIKNLSQALAWLEKARQQGRDYRLRVAGSFGPAHPHVEYLGPLRHQEMGQFYAGIHQLLNFSEYETFGLSLLEALNQGVGLGLRPDSDWARRLRRLQLPWRPGELFDPQHRERALRLAEAFRWTRCVGRWERWLERASGPG